MYNYQSLPLWFISLPVFFFNLGNQLKYDNNKDEDYDKNDRKQ